MKPDRRADDAAVADIFLRAQKSIHFRRDETAGRKNRAVTEVVRVPSRLFKIDPRPIIAFADQVGAARPVKAVVEVPREKPVRL